MPQCLKCGAELTVNEEGIAPVLCDRCAGVATSRARRGLSTGTFRDYPATTLLLGINIAVMAGMILTGGISGASGRDPISYWGANISVLTLTGEYWRLITAGFIHAGFLHIAFNMWCLWSLGQLSEKLFGSLITIGVYLLTGVGGALLSIYVHPVRSQSGVFFSEVGASGAIFGIVGAVLSGVKFGNVSVPSWQKRSITGSLIFFAGFNLYLGAAIPGIDNWCHIGGFISGLLFGVPLATANASGKKTMEWMTILLAALVLVGVGKGVVDAKGPEARSILENGIASNRGDGKVQTLLGDAYRLNEEPDKTIAAYDRALQLNPNDEDVQSNLQKVQMLLISPRTATEVRSFLIAIDNILPATVFLPLVPQRCP